MTSKRINDNFGHSQGMRSVQLTRRIHDAIGPSSLLRAPRGDEFILLLPGYDIHQAEAVTGVIRQAMEALRGE